MSQDWSSIMNFLSAWSFDPSLNFREVRYLIILITLFINFLHRELVVDSFKPILVSRRELFVTSRLYYCPN